MFLYKLELYVAVIDNLKLESGAELEAECRLGIRIIKIKRLERSLQKDTI